jgi:acetolactate synthase-1/2/3 large subunit
VILHTTVGALHAAIGLRAAVHEQVPMVVFAGESMSYGEGETPDPGAQWLRYLSDVGGPARLLQPCVKWSLAAVSKPTFPATVQRACQLAMTSPRGPVLVSVPMELLFETLTTDAPEVAAAALPPAADAAGIEELARMLAEAESPVIVAEEAGRSAAAVERLVALAELLGAPVVETWASTTASFPRTHPLHGGIEPRTYLNEADLFFLVGAVEPWHPASAGPRSGARVAVLDEDPLRAHLPYWGYRVDLCLTGEIERSLALLLGRLRERIAPDDPARRRRAERWGERHHERKRAWREEALALGGAKPIDTRWMVHELNQVLPPDALVVDETVTHRPEICRFLDRVRPGALFGGSYGGLGTGLGTALGVKVAFPGRPVLALIGDGSFNYNPVLAGFGFAQEHGMPILVVLFNNHGYLSQKAPLPQYYPEGWAMRTETFVGTSITPAPDYAGMARLFDGYGERVEEPGQVRPAIERGLETVARGRLALIDVWLEPVNV